MRVLAKAGFTREAVLRCGATKEGRLIDTVLYGRVFPEAWTARGTGG
jgi:RimJ/RimL family protein N-acetyltransferase